jgi:hypothetical protein
MTARAALALIVASVGAVSSAAPAPAAAGPPRPVIIAPRVLLAMSCPSTRLCGAVGDSGLLVTFDPRTPRRARVSTIDALHSLFGIDCPSAAQCTASGNPGRELTFDPSSLRRLGPRLLLPGSDYTTVACAGRRRCVVAAGGQVVSFDPLHPGRHVSARLPTGNIARIACPSPRECVAIDYVGGEVTFDPREPGGARRRISLDPENFSGVSCPTPHQCTAVGDPDGNAVTFDPGDPATATTTSVDPSSAVGVQDVSCPSADQCTLIDGNGREVTFDPHSTGPFVPVALHLGEPDVLAIDCPTATQCTAIGGRRELTFDPQRPRPHAGEERTGATGAGTRSAVVPAGLSAAGETVRLAAWLACWHCWR